MSDMRQSHNKMESLSAMKFCELNINEGDEGNETERNGTQNFIDNVKQNYIEENSEIKSIDDICNDIQINHDDQVVEYIDNIHTTNINQKGDGEH